MFFQRLQTSMHAKTDPESTVRVSFGASVPSGIGSFSAKKKEKMFRRVSSLTFDRKLIVASL